MGTVEENAWEILSGLNTAEVCLKAKANFDKESGIYVLKSFSQEICISIEKRERGGYSSIQLVSS